MPLLGGAGVIGDLAILGPTASGKTALAVELARQRSGLELLSVDAFACYRRLDIGTAKPDSAEREGCWWHLIDVVEPSEELSIATFAALAVSAAEAVRHRGHSLCYVGGSGLYLRSVLDNLTPPPRFPGIAQALEARADNEGVEALFSELSMRDSLAASRMEPTNRRRVIRALEVTLGAGVPFSTFGPGMEVYPEIDCLLVGLEFERAELDCRIALRLEQQLAAGFLNEVGRLIEDEVELSRTAAQAIGYRELAEVVRGTLSLDSAVAEIIRRSKKLARRQLAWLRRDPRITWVDGTRADLAEHLMDLIRNREFANPEKRTMTR